MKDFGQRLRQLREERELTQAEFARLLGVEGILVSRYERNINVPSAETAIRIAAVLRISLDELLAGKKENDDPIKIRHPELLERFRLVDQLPKKDIDAAMNVLDAFVARHEFSDVAARRFKQAG